MAVQSNCNRPEFSKTIRFGWLALDTGNIGCGGFGGARTPTNTSIYSEFLACNSSGEDESESRLEVYVEFRDPDTTSNLSCDAIRSGSLSPILTSADWIEPREGRRYMCKDLQDGKGGNFYILLFSIGNEPCVRREEDETNPAERSSTSSAIIVALSMIVGLVASV